MDSDMKLFARAVLTSLVGNNKEEDMAMLLPTLEEIFDSPEDALELVFSILDISLSLASAISVAFEVDLANVFQLEALDSMKTGSIDNG